MTDLRKKLNDAVEKAVPDILKADQVKRLDQLKVQAAGLQAFAKDDVVTALKLTDDQKDKIKTLSDDAAREMRELRQGGGGQGAFQKIAAMRKETLDKVQSVLTADQKKTWKDMTGDPFEVLFDLTAGLGPGANLIAFEVIGPDGDFDVDVYELGAADPKAFGQ